MKINGTKIKADQVRAMWAYFEKYPGAVLQAWGRKWTRNAFLAAYVADQYPTAKLGKLRRVVARAKATTTDKAWHRAIDRALAGLLGGWIVTEHIGYVLITTDSGQTYTVNGFCNCQAGKNGNSKCKHRCATRLLALFRAPESAATVGASSAVPRTAAENTASAPTSSPTQSTYNRPRGSGRLAFVA